MAQPHAEPAAAGAHDNETPTNLRVLDGKQDLLQHYGIFATLAPSNENAISALSAVVDALVLNPAQFAAASRFVALLSPSQIPISQVLARFTKSDDDDAADRLPGTSFSSDATQLNTPEPVEWVWDACFTFSFSDLPLSPTIGWTVGYGPLRLPQGGCDNPGRTPDMLLAFAEQRAQLQLHKTSAVFTFAPDSGLFAVRSPQALSSIRLGPDYLSQRTGLRVLLNPHDIIVIGYLDFSFQYTTVKDPKALENAKNDFIHEHMGAEKPNPFVSATPTPYDIKVAGWTLMKRAGSGTEASVTSAIKPDNQLVAVKTYQRAWQSEHDARITNIQNLTDCIAKAGHEGGAYVLKLQEVLYSSGSHEPTYPDQMYLLFTPLAQGNFALLMRQWSREPSSAPPGLSSNKPIFLRQLISGIAAIHSAGFIHDDIKPANIGLRSYQPPRLVILDLDMAKNVRLSTNKTWCVTPTPGHGGTVGYMAPERESHPQTHKYGQPVDIWAAGCFAVELFLDTTVQPRGVKFNPHRDRRTFDPAQKLPDRDSVEEQIEQQRDFVQRLATSVANPIEPLIARMLDMDPNTRITAVGALGHTGLQLTTAVQKDRDAVRTGKKRVADSGS